MKRRCLTSLGGIAVLPGLAVMLVQPAAAEQKFSDWSLPVNVGPVVNSGFNDLAPHISKNGLSLYFASTRPEGAFGGEDIWVSQRPDRNASWGPPINLGAFINTASNERSPALSRDGHLLFFATDRPGGFGGLDLWVSQRAHTHDDFAWQEPVNFGAVINTATTDGGASFFENDDTGMPQLFMVNNQLGGFLFDIYVSVMDGASFGPPMLVQELSSPLVDLTPAIRHDGLEIIIASNRPGTPGFPFVDLWVATRQTVSDSWSEPANLGPLVNTEFTEFFPSLSSDGQTLFFTSSRPDGFGGLDLWMSTRVRTP